MIPKLEGKIKTKLTSGNEDFQKTMYKEFLNQTGAFIAEAKTKETARACISYLKNKRIPFCYSKERINKNGDTVKELNKGKSIFINTDIKINDTMIKVFNYEENDERTNIWIFKPTEYQLYYFFNLI